jgi:CSLREA domain-containing protein
VLVLLTGPARAFTFTVSSTGDTADTNTADDTCIATGGGCTLRAAIEQANASAGLDTIEFGITGGSVHTITPTTALPQIVGPVIIDGYKQPGASQNTLSAGDDAKILIELDGSMCGDCPAFDIESGGSGSTIRGLAIGRFDTGISLNVATTCTIEGNFIGTDPTGTIARANANEGISLNGAVGTLIGGNTPAARNVLSGNNSAGTLSRNAGITVSFGSDMNTIQGNFIGVDSTGTAALANIHGVASFLTAHTLIGGTTGAERNVISGNGGVGIFFSSADDNIVRGNFVGTDVTGTKAVGNAQGGIVVGFGQTIGATALTATATDLTTNDTSEFSACLAPPTTTSTSITATTTLTTAPSTTSTSSTSTTSTSAGPTTTVTTSRTISSSTLPSTSTTSTTVASVTTTTLVTGCDAVPDGPTFASILCRVAVLRATTAATAELGELLTKLDRSLGTALDGTQAADAFCAGADKKHAKARLKQVLRQLVHYSHRLRAAKARKMAPEEIREPLAAEADAIRGNATTLRSALSCPDDAS